MSIHYGSGYGYGSGIGSGYGSGYGYGSEYQAIMDSLERLRSGHLLAEPELYLLIKLGLSAELDQVAKRQLYKCRLDVELEEALL